MSKLASGLQWAQTAAVFKKLQESQMLSRSVSKNIARILNLSGIVNSVNSVKGSQKSGKGGK